jgi:hypothetical protein
MSAPNQPQWLSARFTSPGAKVDRENNVLRGFVIAQLGPFKSAGRGRFDLESLRLIEKLGNAKPNGLKSRFTHPDMSSDGLGNFLGRAHHLTMGTAIDARSGERVPAVRGDLHFDKTALDTPPKGGKPLGTYVMDLAESDPDALSSSIVVQADYFYEDAKGKLQPLGEDEQVPDGQIMLWRPRVLHATDIVDTGDAVDGLLSVDGLQNSTLWKGEELLNGMFAGKSRDFVAARLAAFADRYLDRVYGEKEPEPELPGLKSRRDKLAAMAVAAKQYGGK